MSTLTVSHAQASFLEAVELSNRSPQTVTLYGRLLGDFRSWLSEQGPPLAVADIEPRHVRGFLLHLSQRPKRPGWQHRTTPTGGLATETLRGYHRVLSSFFAWCEREGLLNGYRPMQNVPRPRPEHKEMRVLSDAEVKRFLGLLDKPSSKKRTLFVAFSLMWRLGLRISEVCDARLSDLDLDNGSLVVRGKGRKQRRLPVRKGLGPVLRGYVADLRPRYANGCDRLLVSYTGEPLRPSSLRRSFTRYARRCGITGTPHTLRHSFATKAIRRGVNPFKLMRLLGHSDIKTTMRYVHVSDFDDLAAAIDKMA